jgi:hypothetical protein
MTKARDLANASTALSAVDATELGYVDGVTSAIQTQMDAKTAKSTLTTTGDTYYASAAGTPARLGIGSSAQVLTVAAGVPSWATPNAGKVLQIVEASTTSTLSTTSGSYADITGVTATITPSSASSKILVMVNFGAIYPTTSGSGTTYGFIKLLRTATTINETSLGWYLSAGTTGVGDFYFSHTLNQIDSPATTSAVTYKCQHKLGAGSAFYSNTSGGRVSIILMEVTV